MRETSRPTASTVRPSGVQAVTSRSERRLPPPFTNVHALPGLRIRGGVRHYSRSDAAASALFAAG